MSKIIYQKDLSSRAKVIYLYCFEGDQKECEFKIEEARKFFKEGRDALLKAVKELEEKGFIKKQQSRKGNLFNYNHFIRLK